MARPVSFAKDQRVNTNDVADAASVGADAGSIRHVPAPVASPILNPYHPKVFNAVQTFCRGIGLFHTKFRYELIGLTAVSGVANVNCESACSR